MFRRRVIAFLIEQDLLPRDRAEMLLSWKHSGFSLQSLSPGRARGARGPRADGPLHPAQPVLDRQDALRTGAGSVLYRSRMKKKQGGNFAALSSTDFIAAVTSISRTRVSSWCAITAGIRTRLAVSGQNGSRHRSGTAWNRSNRIVRPPPPSGAGSLRKYGNPALDLPRLRGRDESRLLHRRPPRRREDSAAS